MLSGLSNETVLWNVPCSTGSQPRGQPFPPDRAGPVPKPRDETNARGRFCTTPGLRARENCAKAEGVSHSACTVFPHDVGRIPAQQTGANFQLLLRLPPDCCRAKKTKLNGAVDIRGERFRQVCSRCDQGLEFAGRGRSNTPSWLDATRIRPGSKRIAVASIRASSGVKIRKEPRSEPSGPKRSSRPPIPS
jgi:hypothetical protein